MVRITRYTLFKRILPGAVWSIIRTIIIGGLCYVIIYPYIAKIINAFKSYSDFIDPTVRFIPNNPTWDNILTVMQRMDYWPTLVNTAVLSLAVALLTTFISAFVGYGFARFDFKGKGLLFAAVIFTLIVPPQTVIIPMYLRFHFFMGLNLLGTAWPLVILALTGLSFKNGLYIFMLRQNFRNMPKELEEAAYLDGCGAMATYFRIMLPSARNILVTVFLLTFCWQWSDTVYTPLFVRGAPIFTNMVALASTSSDEIVMAASMASTGALLAILPLVVLYIFAQNAFVQSVERSGITG